MGLAIIKDLLREILATVKWIKAKMEAEDKITEPEVKPEVVKPAEPESPKEPTPIFVPTKESADAMFAQIEQARIDKKERAKVWAAKKAAKAEKRRIFLERMKKAREEATKKLSEEETV